MSEAICRHGYLQNSCVRCYTDTIGQSIPGISNNPEIVTKIKARYGELIKGKLKEMTNSFKQSAEVNHPDYYGGADNPYEAIKIIDAWKLNFCLGNVLKYLLRAGKKSPNQLGDLEKARWYLDHEIEQATKEANGPNG